MKKKAAVYLEKDDGGYTFKYDEAYYLDASHYAISLLLPKNKSVYKSEKLFPFFFGLLSEGANEYF